MDYWSVLRQANSLINNTKNIRKKSTTFLNLYLERKSLVLRSFLMPLRYPQQVYFFEFTPIAYITLQQIDMVWQTKLTTIVEQPSSTRTLFHKLNPSIGCDLSLPELSE